MYCGHLGYKKYKITKEYESINGSIQIFSTSAGELKQTNVRVRQFRGKNQEFLKDKLSSLHVDKVVDEMIETENKEACIKYKTSKVQNVDV